MSKADWGFLERLLEDSQEYSTGVGRVWLTVLFLFRILVLGTAAESAWDDEQSDFECNTNQPGCENVCYDTAFPISHFRYFVMQVIFVSTPTIFYFIYVAVHNGERGGAEGGARHDRQLQPKLKGRLLCAYSISTLLKVLLELGFMLGLWILYGFFINAQYVCEREPCPHKVDCFVSRPMEKTIFTIYMQAISAISLFLNVLELLHLLQLSITHHLEKKYLPKPTETRVLCSSQQILMSSGLEKDFFQLTLDEASFPHSHQELVAKETWSPEKPHRAQVSPACPLPDYQKCVQSTTSSSPQTSKTSSRRGTGQSRRTHQYV